jgi:hypothetical protein
LQSHAGELQRTLAVDSKTIRDHLGLIVTLVDTEGGTPATVAADVRGKGHELKATQALLASPEVSLLQATVTADSLHYCQDQTAHIIAREKGGDFVLQVRDNQPTLHQHAGSGAPPFCGDDAGHGRAERWKLSAVCTDAQAVNFPEARRLVKVRNGTTHKKTGQTEEATRHFIKQPESCGGGSATSASDHSLSLVERKPALAAGRVLGRRPAPVVQRSCRLRAGSHSYHPANVGAACRPHQSARRLRGGYSRPLHGRRLA